MRITNDVIDVVTVYATVAATGVMNMAFVIARVCFCAGVAFFLPCGNLSIGSLPAMAVTVMFE